jgi:hypothetical protein
MQGAVKVARATSEELLFLVGGEVRGSGREAAELRRVREHLGNLLSLKTFVVLLGSGASHHLNAPLIRGLDVEAVKGLVATNTPDNPLIDEELALLADLSLGALIDLEPMLNTLNSTIGIATSVEDGFLQVQGKAIRTETLNSLRRKLNWGLAGACDLRKHSSKLEDPLRSDPWAVHRTFLRKILFARRELPATHLFTTNYDLAIEYALDSSAFDYIDGFKGTVERRFHPETYGQALFYKPASEQRHLRPVPGSLYFYKLHGSINWRFEPGEFSTRSIVQRPLSDAMEDLAVIYPTQDKEMETLGYPYADLFRALGDVLQSADVGIISVGYGFNDRHINRILQTAFASNYSLQLFVVDPFGVFETIDAKVQSARFRQTVLGELLSERDARFSALTGSSATFTNFARDFLPDVDSQGDDEDSEQESDD